MPIDYCLILSAGFGTRMGEIGKQIPKVLWPIFDKKLLDLQVAYAKELDVKKIFINTHYLAHEIENHVRQMDYRDEVTLLHEDPILDSGGAIHNLARLPEVNYKGHLLTLNGDLFYIAQNDLYSHSSKLLKEHSAVLFGIRAGKQEKYNETVVENGLLNEIRKPLGDKDFLTFSGVGLINLGKLKRVEGISKFFDTVVEFETSKVKFVTPDSYEYWDFGTADLYRQNISNIFSLLEKNQNAEVIKFLERNRAIDRKKLLNGRYNGFYDSQLKSIDLESQSRFSASVISYKTIRQMV